MSGTPCVGAHLVGELLDGVGVRDVEGVGVRDAAAGGDLRGGVLDAGLVDIADHHFGALAGERQRGLATDAAARAGHGNQSVAEVFARTPDLCPQQSRGRRLSVEDSRRAHRTDLAIVVRMRHRRPVARLEDRGATTAAPMRDSSSRPYGRTNGSLVLTISCTGTST